MSEERIEPRLPAVSPDEIDDDQWELDGRLREGISKHLQGFVSERADGGLIGPFPALQRFPDLGGPTWDLFLALAGNSQLPADVREVVILRVGSVTTAQYELYSHEVRAREAGLSEAVIRTVAAGQRAAELTEPQAIAFDVTGVLLDGRQVPNSLYDASVRTFGQRGTAEIAYLAGCYQLISGLLNLFDVAKPADPAR